MLKLFKQVTEEQKALYQKYRIPTPQEARMRSFNFQILKRQYEASLRKLIIDHGYPDPGKVTLRDAKIVKQLQDTASNLTSDLRNGYNTHLQSQLIHGADEAGIKGWLDSVHKHNAEEVWPRVSSTVSRMAHIDFQQNNAPDTLVRYVPEDAQCDNCKEAVEAGAMPVDEADQYEVGHPGCDHEVEVVEQGDMPDQENLWMG